MASTEPFPSLDDTSSAHPAQGATLGQTLSNGGNKIRRRRKSSGLGGEIRAGDTGGPALSTIDAKIMSPGMLRAKSERDRKARPFSKRRKARSMLRRWKNFALKKTYVVPLIMLITMGLLYAVNPTESNPMHRFIFLSYRVPGEVSESGHYKYSKGPRDFAFVAGYTVFLSFTREFIMQKILLPLAIRSGLQSRAKQARFMEQMYTAIYFSVMGPLGLWVMSHTPVWYFNINGMYEDYPHKILDGDLKFYYLVQGAYWTQQFIVMMLGMEKPRKDFKELVAHHIVSLSLIWASYHFHFTHMGIAVYLTHDISDFFLATSKSLNYVDHPLVGPYFGVFVIVWIYLRHYLNLRILLSEFYEFKTVGPYELIWEIEQYKSPLAHYVSTTLLASLQALNLFWLYAILRIAYRFLFLDQLEDDRSDYEDEEEAEQEAIQEKMDEQAEIDRIGEEKEVKRIELRENAPAINLNGDVLEGKPETEAETISVAQRTRAQRSKA